MKVLRLVLAVAVAVLVAGCSSHKSHDRSDTSQAETVLPLIKPIRVAPQPFDYYVVGTGQVTTDKAVQIFPEIGGRILRVYVREGDFVREGTPLVKLDDQPLRDQLQQVQAQYDLAKAHYEKVERLWQKGIGSEIQYLEARTRKEALEAQLNLLRNQLARTVVKAPFSGYVHRVFAREGELGAPQKPLVTLVGNGSIYVDVYVAERFVKDIRRGQKALLDYSAIDCQETGTVLYVGPYIDPRTRMGFVRIRRTEKHCPVVPNMSVYARIITRHYDSALVVPLYSVIEDAAGNPMVLVLKPTDTQDTYVLESRSVTPDVVTEEALVVREGIQPGELITGRETRALTPGQTVRIEKN